MITPRPIMATITDKPTIVHGCENCFFKRHEFVGPRGNPQAPIVFVGESPGAVELSKKLPFVGPSGKILEDCLPDSMTPDDYYITNAMQCLPRRQDDANKNMSDIQSACSCCRNRLLEEIRAYPRKVIVALGNGALWSLTGRYDLKITKERGKLFHSDLAERGIVASVHPAFLLRGGGSYRKFKMDIEYALDLADGGREKKPIVPEWWIAETESDVREFIDETLARAKETGDDVIGADIETGGFDHRQDEILALGWCHDPEKVFIVPEHLMETMALTHRDFDQAALYGGPLKWMWHNGKFDIKFMRGYGFRSAVDHDTMLMSYCLDPSTRVLKANLSWTTMSELKVGDQLVGFDEYNASARTGTVGSEFKTAVVTGLRPQKAPTYKITTPFGSVVCSAKHMWAVRRFGQTTRVWVSTETLAQSAGKAELSLFMQPFETELTDYEIGYMSGILDGEGHASYTEQNQSWQVGFSQKRGVVLDKCLDILDRAKIAYTIAEHADKSTVQVRFSGGRSQLNAMSIFQPTRLMAKLPLMWQGNRKCVQAEILAIEYLGEGDVIGIETTTRTLIAEGYMSHNCMEEQRGFHDLEQVAQDEIGAPDYKDMIKKYLPKKDASYRVIPKRVLHHYLALDVSNTKQIGTRMYRRLLRDEKNTKLYHRVLLPASELLADVEANGMLVDFAKVRENTDYYVAIMNAEEAKINAISREHGGDNVNPNSPKQLDVLIYDRLKLSTKRKGTGVDVLDKLPQHPAIVALKAYRKAAKAYGTYVKSLHEQVSDDGRVHSTYLIHGTPTGRLASRGPNMQNQPRGPRLRGQFIAPKGRMFCEMDLDQAELRCLAALSKDEALCAIYEQGRKIHKEVSIDIWGADWERRYALDAPGNPEYDQAKEEYMRTKALNFGIIYGREAPSIAAEFEIHLSEAQMMVDGWAKKFPGAWAYIQKCRMAPVKGQNLVTPFGRRKRAGVISRERLRDLQNEAANFPHQSIASDITLLSAVKVMPRLHNWGVKIVNLIHDAILVELPDNMDLCREVAAYVTGEMMKTPVEWGIDRIPFKADAKISNNWGLLHDLNF